MLINNKTIAIVGGGPGGLTLARLLQMQGASVKVYERDFDKDVRVQGATLDLHEESGLRALNAAGLMDAFRLNYRPNADRIRIMDKHAVIIADQHSDDAHQELRPEIDRGPLRQLLLDSLQPGTVIWNSHFKSMIAHGDGWKLEFQNGLSATADIVIGADGANSKIRPYLTPIKPFFAGLTAIEGAVYNSAIATPEIHTFLQNGKIFAFGDNKSLIVSSKGDGSLAFYLGWKTEENWHRHCDLDFTDKHQIFSWFRQDSTQWNSLWHELFEQASTPFYVRPQYCMPLDQTWQPLPNLTVLGDAAHLMPPYAGEGVNMAMQDALELSVCLFSNEFADIQTAIGHYEQHMRVRGAEAAKMTLESMELLHSPEAISFMAGIINHTQPL